MVTIVRVNTGGSAWVVVQVIEGDVDPEKKAKLEAWVKTEYGDDAALYLDTWRVTSVENLGRR